MRDGSTPEDELYAFSYTVLIENLRQKPVQLLERHWIITSGVDQMAEILSPGITGQQPIISHGEAFEYTSGTVLPDPIGFMEGSYTFRSEEGEYFEVGVPKFDLLYPLVIH